MRLWSGRPIDPTLDPATQSAILAIRLRRQRAQRRFARMLVGMVLMALLGAGGTMLGSGGSSTEPTGQLPSRLARSDSLDLDLRQQLEKLHDAARLLDEAP